MHTHQNNLYHWGYSVPDMDEAVKLWTAQGAKVLVPSREAVGLNVLCCVIDFHGAPIELVAPANDAGREQMKPQLANGGGLDHVAYFTNDMESELAAHEKAGNQIYMGRTYNSVFDRDLSFVVTKMGLVVELVDRKQQGRLDHDPLAQFAQRMGVDVVPAAA